VDGVITGAGVLTTVATVGAIVVTFWVMVATGAGSVVGAGVASVGGTVGTTVVSTIVTFAVFAGWVHPLIIAMTMTRMNNPISFFIEITLFLPYN
jgi:hypothetical protein